MSNAKQIPLSQGKVALVDTEDFKRVNPFLWHAVLQNGHWYAARNIMLPDGRRRIQKMHRYIMGLEYGDPRLVDHRDRVNTLDNRKINLRITDDGGNSRNTGISKNNKCGFKGVFLHKPGQWRTRVMVNREIVEIGVFSSPELAARAYDAAVLELHGEFACTNAMLGLLKKPVQSVGFVQKVGIA